MSHHDDVPLVKLHMILGENSFDCEAHFPVDDLMMFVSVWVDQLGSGGADPKLDHILAQLGALQMAASDMQASLDRINAATNNIAADLAGLKALIGTGMSQADVDAVQARLDASVAVLEALAASTPDA